MYPRVWRTKKRIEQGHICKTAYATCSQRLPHHEAQIFLTQLSNTNVVPIHEHVHGGMGTRYSWSLLTRLALAWTRAQSFRHCAFALLCYFFKALENIHTTSSCVKHHFILCVCGTWPGQSTCIHVEAMWRIQAKSRFHACIHGRGCVWWEKTEYVPV